METRGAVGSVIDMETVVNLQALTYDSLVTVGEAAEPRPSLAVTWKHDRDFRRWEFQIRQGVRFHDGTALTASIAAASLEQYGAVSQGDNVIITLDQPNPDFLLTLSNLPIKTGSPEGVGTGPFRRTESARDIFTANENYWNGRPYLDSVVIETGRSHRDQALDFELNKADVVELGLGDSRRKWPNGKRVWVSEPIDLLALEFDSEDERIREAIALSIDRGAINDVLLQKQGAATGAMLPQWLTGYAFLFPAARDVIRARELSRGSAPITIAYTSDDPISRLIVERIAVNARDAGILVRPVAAGMQPVTARLTNVRVVSPSDVNAAYPKELAAIRQRRIVPLFHVPEIYGLGSRVRGWAPSRWGGWRLESVWLAP